MTATELYNLVGKSGTEGDMQHPVVIIDAREKFGRIEALCKYDTGQTRWVMLVPPANNPRNLTTSLNLL